jgi:hypothetical protein
MDSWRTLYQPETLKVQRSMSEGKDILYICLLLRFTKFNEAKKLQKPLYEAVHPLTLFNAKWSSRKLHKTVWNWKWRKSNLKYERLELWTWRNSMQQSPWGASSLLARQEILCLLWSLKVYYVVHKNPPRVSTLSQINLVHTLLVYFYTRKIHFNIILLFMPVYSK